MYIRHIYLNFVLLELTMSRALQFLQTGEIPYKCTAGTKLLTVMENGDLVPCRRMPIVLGNVLKENLLEIYKKSNAIKQLEREEIPKECIKCEHSEKCRGGLKCLTYAMTEKIIGKDPGCSCCTFIWNFSCLQKL